MIPQVIMDCSVTAGWFLRDEVSEHAQSLLERVLKRDVNLIVPELWWYETLNVLRSAVARKRMSQEGASKALYFLEEVPMETIGSSRIGHAVILNLAHRHSLSAYDATYLALSDARGTELLTADKHLLSLQNKYPLVKPLGVMS